MKTKQELTQALNLTGKEFGLLADYAYCDQFMPGGDVKQWQSRMKEAMMEEEGIEMEIGEPIWRPGDKDKLISIFNRQVK